MSTALILSPLMLREEAGRMESHAYYRGACSGMNEAVSACTEALRRIIAEMPQEVLHEVAKAAARAAVLDMQVTPDMEYRHIEEWTGPDMVERVQDLVAASWRGPEATILSVFDDLVGERL